MGQGMSIVSILPWISYFFPSLTEYTKVVGPISVFVFGALGIFTNLLPEPGHIYSVPDLEDLKAELGKNGGIIYLITKLTRLITIWVNWIIATRVYRWFFKITSGISKIASRLKGEPVSCGKTTITPPSPFVVKIDRKRDHQE